MHNLPLMVEKGLTTKIWEFQGTPLFQQTLLERIYKPHYDYQNFSPLANGTDLNRQKYAILQTHWH